MSVVFILRACHVHFASCLYLALHSVDRWTDAFPLRRQNFSCSDPEISCSSHDQQLMADFAFGANVPDSVIYVLSFCVPGFVVSTLMLQSTSLQTLQVMRR